MKTNTIFCLIMILLYIMLLNNDVYYVSIPKSSNVFFDWLTYETDILAYYNS